MRIQPLALPFLLATLVGCRPDLAAQETGSSSVTVVQTIAPPTSLEMRIGRTLSPERARKLDQIEKLGSDAFRKAEAHFDAGRMAEAERQCEAVNRIWGTTGGHMSPDVAHLLGKIRMKQRRHAEAARIMGPNLDTTPTMRLDLALSLAKSGQTQAALRMYDPSLITGYNSAFGDVRRYVPSPKTASDVEGALLWCKAESLRLVGRSDESTDAYQEAFKRFPKNALLAAELGMQAENAGRYEQAVKAYQAVQASGDRRMQEETKQGLHRMKYAAKAVAEAKRAKARP